MYGIFTYIWLIFMVNVGKYTIHGGYGMFVWACILSLVAEIRWCFSVQLLRDSKEKRVGSIMIF